MKKTFVKIVSIVLVLAICAVPAAAAKEQTTAKRLGVSAVSGLLTGILTGINAIVPENKNFKDISQKTNDNFYAGTAEFLDKPAADAKWMLGYGKASLVPSDWQSKNYYLGGYIMLENGFSNKVETVVDDMCARVVAVSDGSGRGVSIFCTIDCIGMTNADIRQIRARLAKMDLGVAVNSINVASTHSHSCIDTEGLWTDLIPKVFGNLFKAFTHIGELESGTDAGYMDFLFTKTADAMKAAVDNMTAGTLTFAQKDISSDYFTNKNRSSASALITDMTRLVFTPADTSKEPTMIVNVAAHPDVAGLPTSDGQSNGRELSGDYIYYMGDTIEKAGYNFMFFNGAIAGIYMSRGASNDGVNFDHRYEQSMRYGNELGSIALSLTKTEAQISAAADWETINADKAESEANGAEYSLWFEGWVPVTEAELEPIMNIAMREVKVQITNPLLKAAGKLNLANYNVYTEGRNYCIFVEIGYMEMGNQRFALMPGEVCQDLVVGGASLTAEGSFSGKAFSGKTIAQIFGEGTTAFGLMNDAIGYLIPDNDYTMAIVDDHYQELISLGENTAGSVMAGFEALANEVA